MLLNEMKKSKELVELSSEFSPGEDHRLGLCLQLATVLTNRPQGQGTGQLGRLCHRLFPPALRTQRRGQGLKATSSGGPRPLDNPGKVNGAQRPLGEACPTSSDDL